MPAKSARSTDAPKTKKPTVKRRPTSTRRRSAHRQPQHSEIAERAYFIHLEEGSSDEVANWLRAERELTPA
jgi:hypothetical protein